MLRLFLLAIIVYFLLRMLRRVVLLLATKSPRPRPSGDEVRSSSPPGNVGVIDEMKRCPTCGTYNPTRLAYRKKDLYFCNDRCHEDFIRREQAS